MPSSNGLSTPAWIVDQKARAEVGVKHEPQEQCARHSIRYTARTLSYFFLCDSCADRLVSEAFNGRHPVFRAEPIEGFCGLCNELTDVRFCQWFLCPICFNVVAGYQKGFVAARAVREFWDTHVRTSYPNFNLEETDPIQLTPFVRGSKTKRQSAETLKHSDFLVSEHVGDQIIPRFHIELKTGPGSIVDMPEFQLDVNDFNDIVGPAINTGLPVYIFHAQVGFEYHLPTRGAVVRNMWWTDLIELERNYRRSASRRDEARAARYYDPKAFRETRDFAVEIRDRRFEVVREHLLANPPRLIG